MKHYIQFLLLLVGFATTAFAEAETTFPTHCKTDEFAYLNAKMVIYKTDSKGYFLNEKNGKILSICADKAKEPFGKVFYRYGAIGKVEMEQVATSTDKWGIYNRITSPHTGRNIFSFRIGNFNYYIGEETAQGSGVELMVFKSGKRVANLFSGYSSGIDYESGLLDVAFGSALSPTFVEKEPADEGI